MRDFLRSLSNGKSSPLHGRPIARSLVGTLGLKILSIALLFGNSIIMARLLGGREYGIYAYVMAWISILSLVALFGIDRLLVRELAVFAKQERWGQFRGILRWSDRQVILLSGALFALALLVVLLSPFPGQEVPALAFLTGMLFVPVASLTRVRQSMLQGLRRVAASQVPEFLVRPALLGLLLVLARRPIQAGDGAQWALSLNVIAMTVALGVSIVMARRFVPAGVASAVPEFHARDWTRSGFVLLFLGGMHILSSRTDTVMLGILGTPEEVGVYAVAARGAWFVLLAVVCVNAVISPTVSARFATGDRKRLQLLVTRSARAAFLLSALTWGCIALGGRTILALFGPEFPAGSRALLILSTGLLVCSQAPSGGILLINGGHERRAAIGAGWSALLNGLLNLILIPRYSIEGAAAATAASMLFLNLYSLVYVRRLSGIDASVLGLAPGPGGERPEDGAES